MKLLLVGNFSPEHIGMRLLSAARDLGVQAEACDSGDASAAPRWMVSVYWHFANRRPPLLGSFGTSVVDICRRIRPDALLATGSAPLDARALHDIGVLGVWRINYSTDDPWSPVHRSPWLLASLKEYDAIFSPRKSNLEQLRSLNGPAIEYLPFAYDPAVHFCRDSEVSERNDVETDVLFVGGADRDRVALVRELFQLSANVALYGAYWDRYRVTRHAARGVGSPEKIREATHAAKVSLCLIRRSNRDGHVMRSFEMAAMGACMLVEYTEEHREIFGEEGEAVLYFRSAQEMQERVRWLLSHPAERASLRHASFMRIATSANTYASRLERMLNQVRP